MMIGNINIIQVYEVLETPTSYHIVQEYYDGYDFDDKRTMNEGLF